MTISKQQTTWLWVGLALVAVWWFFIRKKSESNYRVVSQTMAGLGRGVRCADGRLVYCAYGYSPSTCCTPKSKGASMSTSKF